LNFPLYLHEVIHSQADHKELSWSRSAIIAPTESHPLQHHTQQPAFFSDIHPPGPITYAMLGLFPEMKIKSFNLSKEYCPHGGLKD
jgi:hypothetical protein